MKVNVKLFASLSKYLPAGTKGQETLLEAANDATPHQILTSLGVPLEQCHLVVINGFFVPPEARNSQTLNEGDALAVWPPVAGG